MSDEGRSAFQLQYLETGAVQRMKRTGPRTDPCGTPKEIGAGSDV